MPSMAERDASPRASAIRPIELHVNQGVAGIPHAHPATYINASPAPRCEPDQTKIVGVIDAWHWMKQRGDWRAIPGGPYSHAKRASRRSVRRPGGPPGGPHDSLQWRSMGGSVARLSDPGKWRNKHACVACVRSIQY